MDINPRLYSSSSILLLLMLIVSVSGCSSTFTPFLKSRPAPKPAYQPSGARHTTFDDPAISNEYATAQNSATQGSQDSRRVEPKNTVDLSVDDQWIMQQLQPDAIALMPIVRTHNRDLQIAREAFLNTQRRYQTAQQFLRPSASVSASKGVSVASAGTSHGTGFGLTAVWSIDLWRDLGVRQRQDLLSFKTAQLNYKQAYIRTMQSTLSQWISLAALQAEIEVQQDQMALLNTLLAATKSSYVSGIVDIQDVIRFQTDIDSLAVSIAGAQQNFRRQLRSLQLTLGQHPDGTMVFSKADLNIGPLSAILPEDYPVKLVARRIDIQQAWLSLLQSDIGLALAQQNLFPSLSFSLSGGFSADTLPTLLRKSNAVVSLGTNAAMQVLKRDALKREKLAAASGVKVAELSYQNTTYRAFLDVEQLFEDEQKLYARFLNSQASQVNAAKAESTEIRKYLNRDSSFLNVIEAQRSALGLRQQLIGLKATILRNRLSLYVAMGGGFDIHSESALGQN